MTSRSVSLLAPDAEVRQVSVDLVWAEDLVDPEDRSADGVDLVGRKGPIAVPEVVQADPQPRLVEVHSEGRLVVVGIDQAGRLDSGRGKVLQDRQDHQVLRDRQDLQVRWVRPDLQVHRERLLRQELQDLRVAGRQGSPVDSLLAVDTQALVDKADLDAARQERYWVDPRKAVVAEGLARKVRWEHREARLEVRPVHQDRLAVHSPLDSSPDHLEVQPQFRAAQEAGKKKRG